MGAGGAFNKQATYSLNNLSQVHVRAVQTGQQTVFKKSQAQSSKPGTPMNERVPHNSARNNKEPTI